MSYKVFPSNSDYTTIVKNLSAFVSDESINKGEPLYSKSNRLVSYAGGYSKVFPIEINSNKKALRFWTANIEDSKKRYQAIDQYLKVKKLPYFVGFDYHHDKLIWKQQDYSFVSMDWVEGITLNKYIDANIHDSHKMKVLAESFLDMVKELHTHTIAHGDLQDGNILVMENSSQINLKLIDYDSLYVPALKNYDIEIIGVEAYQHPKKNDFKRMNEKIDYFSELVIYLSLLAYSEDGNLWIHGQDQKLLFDVKDFKDTTSSIIFQKLKSRNFSSQINELIQKLEIFCDKNSLDELSALEDIIKDKLKDIKEIMRKMPSSKTTSVGIKIDKKLVEKKMKKLTDIFGSISKKVQIDTDKLDNQMNDIMKNMQG